MAGRCSITLARRPVPAKYENLVHAVGLILLLIFMAVVSFSDIYKLIVK